MTLEPCNDIQCTGIIIILMSLLPNASRGSSPRTQRHSLYIVAQPKGLDMLNIIANVVTNVSKLIVTLENNKFGSLVFVAIVGFSALMTSKDFI